jgi:ornithine carbamoyltransferase
MRHFLDISQAPEADLKSMLRHARAMKQDLKAGKAAPRPLEGKVLAMVFEKPSTRTRVSFEVGMRQLGGQTIFLSGSEMQLGRAESIADTARVMSRYVDAIVMRTASHERLTEMAQHATVPVINALTDDTHPCQIMADVMTYEEKRGDAKGRRFAWTGDGNNVLNSLMEASARFGFALNIATPPGSEPGAGHLRWARDNGATIGISTDPRAMVADADCVFTDAWVSMNQEHRARGHNVFQPYQVNAALMRAAAKDALFMHCLPAHRGEEVTDEVIDGPQSVVFDEAENRLHAQKAILAWCLGVTA